MAESDPRKQDASQQWMTQPEGHPNPSTNGVLTHHQASPGGTSDNLSQQVTGRGAPFRGGTLPPPPPPHQQQIQSFAPYGTPADLTAAIKADVGSVGVMASSTAPPATVPSATTSFVTSAVKGGWFIGDPGTEPGGAPGAAITVMPISLTPQGILLPTCICMPSNVPYVHIVGLTNEGGHVYVGRLICNSSVAAPPPLES